jgi:hypothetical protein
LETYTYLLLTPLTHSSSLFFYNSCIVLPDPVGVGSSGAVLGMLASWIVWILFRWCVLLNLCLALFWPFHFVFISTQSLNHSYFFLLIALLFSSLFLSHVFSLLTSHFSNLTSLSLLSSSPLRLQEEDTRALQEKEELPDVRCCSFCGHYTRHISSTLRRLVRHKTRFDLFYFDSFILLPGTVHLIDSTFYLFLINFTASFT